MLLLLRSYNLTLNPETYDKDDPKYDGDDTNSDEDC
jgi:hypothetical protein